MNKVPVVTLWRVAQPERYTDIPSAFLAIGAYRK